MNTILYVSDFGEVQTLLKKKYRKPTTYKFITDECGAVLLKGGLTIISLWSRPETEIVHLLTGSPQGVAHTISYKSKMLLDTEGRAKERGGLNNR